MHDPFGAATIFKLEKEKPTIELNGVANVLLKLELQTNDNVKTTTQIIDESIKELHLFCKYVRAFEENNNIKWHEFKAKEGVK